MTLNKNITYIEILLKIDYFIIGILILIILVVSLLTLLKDPVWRLLLNLNEIPTTATPAAPTGGNSNGEDPDDENEKWKKWIKRILIVTAVVVSAAVLGYIGYSWYKNSQLPSLPPSPTVEPDVTNVVNLNNLDPSLINATSEILLGRDKIALPIQPHEYTFNVEKLKNYLIEYKFSDFELDNCIKQKIFKVTPQNFDALSDSEKQRWFTKWVEILTSIVRRDESVYTDIEESFEEKLISKFS